MPLRNSAHGRITTHLSDSLHVHGDEQYFRAHIGGGSSSFTTGMTGTNNNDIVMIFQV